MNILLTGSEGQLGKSIIATLPKNINIIQTNKKNLDICNFKQLNFFLKNINLSLLLMQLHILMLKIQRKIKN